MLHTSRGEPVNCGPNAWLFVLRDKTIFATDKKTDPPRYVCVRVCVCVFFFFPSHLLFLPFFSLPPIIIVVTQIRGHIAGSSPSPLRFGPCIFFHLENIQLFPRRLPSNFTSVRRGDVF